MPVEATERFNSYLLGVYLRSASVGLVCCTVGAAVCKQGLEMGAVGQEGLWQGLGGLV